MISKKKIALIILLTVFVMAAGIFTFFWTIISREEDNNQQAIARAYEQSDLVEVERVESFVGSEPFVIVFGEDAEFNQIIVWVSESNVHWELAADGVSEQDVRDRVLADNPDSEIIRATPGMLGEEYVWEVYYRQEHNGEPAYFYEYYTYDDGSYIDTYRLGVRAY